MKPMIVPTPEQPVPPQEQPAPEVQPRRRTFIPPVFTGRVRRITRNTVATMTLLIGVYTAQAQTQPFPDPPSSPGVPPQPMNPDAPREPRTTPQQPATPQTQDGWIMFDDRSTEALNLKEGQLQRLRELDGRYRKDYMGLGNTPSQHPGYKSLSDRRNTDVKGILTPEQYEQWMNMRSANEKRMDGGTEGGMKEEGTSVPSNTMPGTGKPKTAPATTPAPKTTPTPKN